MIENEKLRMCREIYKEAKYLVKNGYGDVRIGKLLHEVNDEPAQDTDDE